MTKNNIFLEKSYQFSLAIVDLYKDLTSHKEFIICKQLLRSGTSVGANIHEAQGSISKKEFYSKMQIAYKELLETDFWLHLLKDSKYLDQEKFDKYSSRTGNEKNISFYSKNT